MKRSLILVAAVLFASACSTQNNSSETNGVPGSPVLSPRLNLSCLEKQVLADAPGYEHALSIRELAGTANVQRRWVSMQGQGEWEAFDHDFLVTTEVNEEGATQSMTLVENVNKDIDWKTEGSCFKLVPQQSYRIAQDAEGNWSGTAELIGNILLDPEVEDCSFPHVARPPQYEIACSYQ